ncbi:MAG: hypothetical protein JNJ58_04205 [Chitinophagaceae bacterium]|nr:hypothetical protein [Chitinophagaceae bacterium]
MKNATEQLWDYADGLLNEEEAAHMERLLSSDPEMQKMLNEILDLKSDLQSDELIHQPSMRFSANVMDKWAMQKKPLSSFARPDRRIVLFVFSLLGILLVGSIFMALISTRSIGTPTRHLEIHIPELPLNLLQTPMVMYSLMILFTATLLLWLDKRFGTKIR